MGPTVNVESVPGFIDALEQITALLQATVEGGQSIGLTAEAQCGAPEALEMVRSAATQARQNLGGLVEAASAVRGADQLTVAAARAQ